MNSSLGVRMARLRDLVLLVLTMVGATLASVLVAGRIWMTTLFETALRGQTVEAALGFAALALVAGVLYLLLPPPCQAGADRRIKGASGGP